MKFLRILMIVLVGALIVIQFFPTMTNKSDLVPATDLIQTRDVPSHVATMLHNACYDCHSNNTDYPWYVHIQPFAWVLEGDIKEGKADLDFNKFDIYSTKKQKKKLEGIKHSIEKKTMPPTGYKLMHSEARLSKDERKQIKDWVDEELKAFH